MKSIDDVICFSGEQYLLSFYWVAATITSNGQVKNTSTYTFQSLNYIALTTFSPD
jgi:hypothetical protein